MSLVQMLYGMMVNINRKIFITIIFYLIKNFMQMTMFYKVRFRFYGKTYDKKGEGTCWQDNAAS